MNLPCVVIRACEEAYPTPTQRIEARSLGVPFQVCSARRRKEKLDARNLNALERNPGALFVSSFCFMPC